MGSLKIYSVNNAYVAVRDGKAHTFSQSLKKISTVGVSDTFQVVGGELLRGKALSKNLLFKILIALK